MRLLRLCSAGVRVELVPEEGMPAVPDTGGKPAQVGRIWISGEHLASGYIGDAARTAEHFFTAANGTRWYRTDDYGSVGSRQQQEL